MAAGYDCIIREAAIYDGSGAPPVAGDVAIEGDRIAAVHAGSRAAPMSGRTVLDARGLALAPGFIDVHTHDDFAALMYPDMAFKLAGGVTTCVVGNCGFGAAPHAAAAVMAKTLHPNLSLPEWQGYKGYMQRLEAHPPGVNIGVLVGHGTARLEAMRLEKGVPTQAQMAAMKSILTEGLEAGALGLSSGLVYDPGRFAATEELVELASLMRGTGALYATHMRDESTGLLDSVREALAIGAGAGVPVQISHHKASGRTAWGLVRESLKLIEEAQSRGQMVQADQYPYTAGSTILAAVYRDGKLRGAIGDLRPEDVVIASTASHPEWEGRSLAQLGVQMGCTPEQAAERVLAADDGVTAILHAMCEEDVRTVMRHPSTMIGSDGIPTIEGRPHPRLYGSFARVLGRYAREEKLFSMEEAVYRMTGFAAAKFGLKDRGLVRAGAFADLVLFDPAKIIDRGTFDDPKRLPDGIRAVFVNGRKAVDNSAVTGVRTGRVLRRS
jgi:N-acyl-D-amino-acid deacylase